MPAAPAPASPTHTPPVTHPPAAKFFEDFWRRVTDGLEVDQLWSQFKADARAGYRLYSREVDTRPAESGSKMDRALRMLRTLFWAILMKMSPARRVLFLLALVLMILPAFTINNQEARLQFGPVHFYGDLLMLGLLLMEIGDRVIMKRDLEIAREIQLWLVPSSAPRIPGLELAFLNRPANTVAGDYYDVLTFGAPDATGPEVWASGGDPAGAGARHLLVVADVAGKSLPAALLMATFQASLRSLCSTLGNLPDLTRALNRYACTNSRGGLRFTTAVLALFDASSRELTYINAGHNPPLVRRTDGTIELLEAGGMPFGISETACYDSGRVTLAPGDRFLIYTDGLTEAVNERDEEFSEERLTAWFASATEAPASNMVSQLMSNLDAFTAGTHQRDDMTCILVRVVPQSA